MGFFDKLKEGLKKTTQILNTDIRDLFKSQGRLIDEKFLDELFTALIKTDMGVPAKAVTVIIHDVAKENWGTGGEQATKSDK